MAHKTYAALVLAAVLCIGMAGCGRKGPLEAPGGSTDVRPSPSPTPTPTPGR